MNTQLNMREAADLLGVSTSTFKRLCDRHNVPLERTPGGHRRIRRDVFEQYSPQFVRAGGATNRSHTNLLGPDAVVEMLMTRKAQALATKVLSGCHEVSDLVRIVDEALVPAMWQVGAQWQRGEVKVFQVHLCTETMLLTADLLHAHFRRSTRSTRVAVGGSLHCGVDTLASKFVALCLASVGCEAVDLGPRVPADEMALAATALDADMVWCTHTHWDGHAGIIGAHTELRERLPPGVQVLIGGGGLSPSARLALSWCKYFETFRDMATAVANDFAESQRDRKMTRLDLSEALRRPRFDTSDKTPNQSQ